MKRGNIYIESGDGWIVLVCVEVEIDTLESKCWLVYRLDVVVLIEVGIWHLDVESSPSYQTID